MRSYSISPVSKLLHASAALVCALALAPSSHAHADEARGSAAQARAGRAGDAHAQAGGAADARTQDERVADAQDNADATDRLARLRAELGVYAKRAWQERTATNIATGVAAAALVPAGSILWTRSDPLARSIGVGMTLSGSIPVAFMVATLFPSSMERLRNGLDKGHAKGMPDLELVNRIEAGWERAARLAHKRRTIIGAIDLSLGAATLGTGLFFLMSKPVAGMTQNDQYTLGSALSGTGLPLLTTGLRFLVQETLEETSWQAHRAALSPLAAGRAPLIPSVSVAPLRGGAAAVMNLTF